MTNKNLYYECHITVEPVFGERLEHFKEICARYKFHVAKLLMKKGLKELPNPNDAFCTGRSKDYEDIMTRMVALMTDLLREGFAVWRYKIEDTILDSHSNDHLFPLEQATLPSQHQVATARQPV